MKKIPLLALNLIFFSAFTFAQEIKKDSNNCKCNYNIPTKYPNVDEKDELYGTVIVEYEIDSACISSNPKIIQSLGPDYDKECLRVTNLAMILLNKCNTKCRYKECEKRKAKVPFNFVNPYAEDRHR